MKKLSKLTVAKLILELKKMPADVDVYCFDVVNGLSVDIIGIELAEGEARLYVK